MGWIVYVLVSESSGRTYVGITLDAARRLDQHNGIIPGGAKATRGWRPWRLGVSYGPYDSKGAALRVERRVKRLRGARRLSWDGTL